MSMSGDGTDHNNEDADPAAWVDRHGRILYRYALVRVRGPEVAEDLVQEALLAAWKGHGKFEGKSSERTWLIGILRHKILDYLRSRSKGAAGMEETNHSDLLADFFDEQGRWNTMPDPAAARPEILLEQGQFWEVFDHCLDDLSPRYREAFVLRVIEQEDTDSICKQMEITATNMSVILFRARTQMRRCLMLKWFEKT
jgi:RNA polymerase sigma-70 factor (TIGR02943 family)